MAHTAETLLPWNEYCRNLNHSEIVHRSRAKYANVHTQHASPEGYNF